MSSFGRLNKHRVFIGNIAALMSGKTIAAIVALGTMPVVARLFSPDDFGVAASYLSVIGIVSHVATLRYERTIVLPKSETEAAVLMGLTYRILLAVCILFLAVLAVYEAFAFTWPVFEILGHWRWLLPLGVLLMAGLQVQEAWIGRQAEFKLIAKSTVLGTLINASIRIGSGMAWGSSVLGLISSNLIGMLSRTVYQRAASVRGLQTTFRHIPYPTLKSAAASYSDFPKFDAPAGLIFSFGQNLPVLFFGTMFSPAAAGLYAMANRLSQAPLTVVSDSVRRVFLQKAARINNQNRSLLKAYLLTTAGLALMGVGPLIVLTLFAEPLLGWLLGERWIAAGRYLAIMAPWLFMIWVTAPANPVFSVLRRQKLWLTVQSLLTLSRLCAFGVAFWVGAGPEGTLRAFVAATVAANVVTISIALHLINSRARHLQLEDSVHGSTPGAN